jgi:AraC-like DNA-binding protein
LAEQDNHLSEAVDIQMTSSTLTSWALLIWNALKAEGYDPAPVFKRVGADPAKLSDGQARYDVRQMYLLWDNAVKLTGNSDFGVTVGQQWGPTTFNALGFAWLASSSLLDALRRAVRYAQLVNNSLILQLAPLGASYSFTLETTTKPEWRHEAALDAGIAAIITMCRMLVGAQFAPVEMRIAREYRVPGQLESFAGCATTYRQSDNALIIAANTAAIELPTGNSNLALINEHAAAEYLKRLNKDDVVGAVRASIAKLLPTGVVSEETVADTLNVNMRTMQRKLKDEAQSFRGILNSTREDIAQDYIRNSQLSLTEIAYLLGFADQANFTRAFKRWTGASPSDYRKHALGKKTPAL